MHSSILSSIVGLFVFISSTPFIPYAHAQTVEAVAMVAKPSVGVILAKRPDGIFSGTGFMGADRFVLTAYHVIEGASRIVLKFPDYPPVDASVAQSDKDSDVAVLSIPAISVRPLPLGDIGQVREGQTVVVLGFPRVEALGTETATVTEGIISAVRPNVLQMQTPISPGNSGGPVLNLQGEVVGIVRATLQGQQQGINFATAINTAKPLLGAAIGPAQTPLPAPASPPLPGAVQAGDALVVPGQHVGPVALGMTTAAMFQVMGEPTLSLRISAALQEYGWGEPGQVGPTGSEKSLRVSVYSGKVYQIISFSSQYSTADGLSFASDERRVTAVMGAPNRTISVGGLMHTLDYNSGIAFNIAGGLVVSIEIFYRCGSQQPPLSELLRGHCGG